MTSLQRRIEIIREGFTSVDEIVTVLLDEVERLHPGIMENPVVAKQLRVLREAGNAMNFACTMIEAEQTEPEKEKSFDAPAILRAAENTLNSRASERDLEKERSMARIVAAFNAITGYSLTEADGWAFMVMLKMGRYFNGRVPQRDTFIDGAAYFALMGESLEKPEKD